MIELNVIDFAYVARVGSWNQYWLSVLIVLNIISLHGEYVLGANF